VVRTSADTSRAKFEDIPVFDQRSGYYSRAGSGNA
jgi:hypothetical protein